ncbi:hypothetical protein C5167_022562 [Papaver somniferum]|uniref:Glutathione S-transferase n=1 Tax=Papaver somniferum TaxID=3469 RepID=A0A4Y7JJR7_PAPSO|nr:glutathione S-transferase U10-like [Papaver somniferum]RZC60796.1 hypothetical protein C5167_022562 [Papaver somniferum]
MEKEKQAEVKLHGMWASGFSKRVELALKLKGIPYEYFEENLPNKSDDLLKYNPVHGKVPVLVHKGKPIVESLVILEYIDENWKTAPRLFPTDPYGRARIRFWEKYIDDQLFKNLITAMRKQGEEQDKGMKEFAKNLEVLEEGIKEFYSNDKPAFDGESPIFLSITLIGILGPYKTFEKVGGVKLIHPEKNPFLINLLHTLSDLPEVKECFPPAKKFETLMQHYKKLSLKQSST